MDAASCILLTVNCLWFMASSFKFQRPLKCLTINSVIGAESSIYLMLINS